MAVTRFLAALGLVSVGHLVYGLWLAWPPLGFISLGVAGLAFALLYDTDRTGGRE